MNNLPRRKYEILDIFFTIFLAVSMVLSAIFLLHNLIVSIIFIVVIVLFTFEVIILWRSRNPFNTYLVRAFAVNNFIFTLITLIAFYLKFYLTLTANVGYIVFLFPSGIYLLFSFKFSAITTPSDKKEGALLAYTGRTKAAELRLLRYDPEEERKRTELIAKQKEQYNFKLIIRLAVIFTLSCIIALIFGLI
ncbi:MAG: hypothetical protein ACFE91_04810 [Promethearchaeota archaeon]